MKRRKLTENKKSVSGNNDSENKRNWSMIEETDQKKDIEIGKLEYGDLPHAVIGMIKGHKKLFCLVEFKERHHNPKQLEEEETLWYGIGF